LDAEPTKSINLIEPLLLQVPEIEKPNGGKVGVGVGVLVELEVIVGVGVGVLVELEVIVGVGVGVFVSVNVGVGVLVELEVIVGVSVFVAVGVGVGVTQLIVTDFAIILLGLFRSLTAAQYVPSAFV
jgi:hypothetical protein